MIKQARGHGDGPSSHLGGKFAVAHFKEVLQRQNLLERGVPLAVPSKRSVFESAGEPLRVGRAAPKFRSMNVCKLSIQRFGDFVTFMRMCVGYGTGSCGTMGQRRQKMWRVADLLSQFGEASAD